VLLGLALSTARAEDIRFRLVAREAVEGRLREYSGTNIERGARLKQMFVDAGCGDSVSEQPVKYSKAPNVICVLPGTSDRVIIVGAHFDHVSTSAGVAGILHTRKDKLSAMNLDDYYDTYHVAVVFLVYLDHFAGEPETAATPTP